MANEQNSSYGTNQQAGKSVLYQIGVGLVALAATFLVIGFIVRTVLIMNQ